MLSSRRLEEDCPRPVVSIADLRWPDDPAEIPDWVYTDQRIFELEQERIFLGPTWNYVALKRNCRGRATTFAPISAAFRSSSPEIKQGLFTPSKIAARIVAWNSARPIAAITTQFICPYHQWTYDLSGSLISVPFRRGVKGKGGMPDDFRLDEHHLRALNVTCRHGVIFASRHDDMEPLESYLGAEILDQFDSIFDGRELKILGVHRNTMPANWKLYQENLKDPYHATLASYLSHDVRVVRCREQDGDHDRRERAPCHALQCAA